MSGSMDELDKSRMSFRWRSESRERRRDFVYDALNMRNECRKIPRREGDVAEEGQWRRVV